MINLQNVIFMLVISLVSFFLTHHDVDARVWKSPYGNKKQKTIKVPPYKTPYNREVGKDFKAEVPSTYKKNKRAFHSIKKSPSFMLNQKEVYQKKENVSEKEDDYIAQMTDEEFHLCLNNLGNIDIDTCAKEMSKLRKEKEKKRKDDLFVKTYDKVLGIIFPQK